ncbi:MAG: hypothetical protein ACR2OZ_16575 [Verrucomicrobiales bacterium]
MITRPAFLLLAVGTAFAGLWLSWSRYQVETVRCGERSVVKFNQPARFVSDPVAPMQSRRKKSALEESSELPLVEGKQAELQPTEALVSVQISVVDEAMLPSREELEVRAFKVEQEANHELHNLLEALDLTDEQQDRVFTAVARQSSYYHPTLQFQNAAGGALPISAQTGFEDKAAPSIPTAVASPDTPKDTEVASVEPDPVISELGDDHELIERYRNYKDEREEFWAGVVQKIESQLNEASSGN